jgi:hypothetical protein
MVPGPNSSPSARRNHRRVRMDSSSIVTQGPSLMAQGLTGGTTELRASGGSGQLAVSVPKSDSSTQTLSKEVRFIDGQKQLCRDSAKGSRRE